VELALVEERPRDLHLGGVRAWPVGSGGHLIAPGLQGALHVADPHVEIAEPHAGLERFGRSRVPLDQLAVLGGGAAWIVEIHRAEIARELETTVREVRDVLRMAQQPISLQSPVGESEETNFGDFIEDKGAENPSDMTAIVLLKEKIKDVLETLTERERQVLEQRFGLVDGYSRTLEEVGRQFRVTRERIRQIEAKALRKMRHPTRIRQLEGFLEAAEA